MILQTITKNYTQAIFSIIILGLLLWLNVFLFEDLQIIISHNAVGYLLIDGLLSQMSILANVIALALVFFQGFLLAGFSGRYNLLGRTNMLPALLFVLLSSFEHHYNFLNPVLLSSTFLILMLHVVGRVGEKTEASKEMFDSGALIALASMFYVPSLFFVIFIWMTLVSYRIFRWREWVASMLGVILPYFFLIVIYFLNDQLNLRIEEFIKQLRLLDFTRIHLQASDVIFFSLVLLMFIPALVRFVVTRNEKTIYIRRIISIVLNYLFTVVIMLVFVRDSYAVLMSLLFVPIALIISDYLSVLKKRYYKEFLFLVLIVVVIATKLM
ncbi:MAG: hypothetical protein JEZ03_04830 [Bacteroidales bacterium]|nr:hypothetical protein [Bacteroidales bacterium]